MRKHLKIFGCYFRLNLSSALEYRASFFTQVLGIALNNGSFVVFWWIAFDQIGGRIAGYSFEDVMFIWAVASTGFGLAHILFANASSITRLIVTGELDAFLLQPCNTLLNVICAKTNLGAYGDFFYGFILMALIYGANIAAWGWFLYGVILAAVLFTAVTVTAHSLTFFVGDASVIGSMALEFMINFSVYPDKIYAPAVRAVMYSLIPSGFAVHVPLGFVTGFSPIVFAVCLGASVLYLCLAAWLFGKGLKRYESGNAIVMKS
jgi:ABC-2 type transport system permease protein